MKYLINGGAGFIGSRLSLYLQKKGHYIIVLDNFDKIFSYPANDKLRNLRAFDRHRGKIYKHDIRDTKALKEIFDIHKFDGVFHLAAKAGVRNSVEYPIHYFNVNVAGTINVIKQAIKHDVGKFIFASSSSVYGKRVIESKPFHEFDLAIAPISPYAASKRCAEISLYPFREYMDTIACLRLFNVYGPCQRPDTALHKFAIQIHKGFPITRYGIGNTWRDYTHVSDICNGFEKAMKESRGYEIFNLGNGKPRSLSSLIFDLTKEMGVYPYKIGQLPLPKEDVPYTHADITLAKEFLGWEPIMEWKSGVKDFVKWFKEDIKIRDREDR